MFAIYYQGVFWAKSNCFVELCELASISLNEKITIDDIPMYNWDMRSDRVCWVGIDKELNNEIDLNGGDLPHFYDCEQRVMKLNTEDKIK